MDISTLHLLCLFVLQRQTEPPSALDSAGDDGTDACLLIGPTWISIPALLNFSSSSHLSDIGDSAESSV